MTEPPVLLIAGCGYLGMEVARQAAASGWRVFGMTRHAPEPASDAARCPAGFSWLEADITRPESLEIVRAALPARLTVLHAASSSRGGPEAYQKVFVEGTAHLLDVFQPDRLVFTSSTSVYGQTDGSRVDEFSPARPGTATGELLLKAESTALQSGATVARLAGIYGPGRSILLKKFLSGEARIEDGGSRVVNQIHRDDAASAILTLCRHPDAAGAVFNVADDLPMAQRDVYAALANHFGRSLPPDGPRPEGRKRGWTSKQVSNTRMRSLGWQPSYPSFLDALHRDQRLSDTGGT